MINQMIAGISDALYEEFGDGYEIYKEASMQDIEEPAFFVRCLTPNIKNQTDIRRKVNVLFAIQYFPESEKPHQEMNEVYERLSDCLELISVEGKNVRGEVECRDMSDTLTATAEYKLFICEKQELPYMEELNTNQEVKHG